MHNLEEIVKHCQTWSPMPHSFIMNRKYREQILTILNVFLSWHQIILISLMKDMWINEYNICCTSRLAQQVLKISREQKIINLYLKRKHKCHYYVSITRPTLEDDCYWKDSLLYSQMPRGSSPYCEEPYNKAVRSKELEKSDLRAFTVLSKRRSRWSRVSRLPSLKSFSRLWT